jgi:hypothetical protein
MHENNYNIAVHACDGYVRDKRAANNMDVAV